MNAKEKFEMLIEKIEKMVTSDSNNSAKYIAVEVSNMNYLSYRETCVIFSYLTGYSSLLDYIRERKMMASYKMLISCPILNIEAAVVVSGYDNQSSFSKKFKEQFQETPSEAFSKKDQSKLIPPLTWDVLSSDASRFFDKCIEIDEKEKTKFGVSTIQYEKMMRAADLQALHELNDEQSEVAFELSEEYNLPLEATFNYIEDISLFYFCDDADRFVGSKKDLNTFIEVNQLLSKLYLWKLNGEVDIVDCQEMLRVAEAYCIDVFSIKTEYLMVYLKKDFRFDQFVKLVNFFEVHNGDDFEDYLNKVEIGYSPNDALHEDNYDGFLDIFMSDEEVDAMMAFEKWAEEQTSYNEKIDTEYDEDNPFYSEEEDDDIDSFVDSDGDFT